MTTKERQIVDLVLEQQTKYRKEVDIKFKDKASKLVVQNNHDYMLD